MEGLTSSITDASYLIVGLASASLVALALICLTWKSMPNAAKPVMFWLIALVIILPTTFLTTATVYVNQKSISRGPVHWHADFQIWACGQEFNLRDPQGFSNKIGTPLLHEHNDKRIHVEGPILTEKEVRLGHFFQVIGGAINDRELILPGNDSTKKYSSGDPCPNETEASQVQVFAYTTSKEGVVSQRKLTHPEDYIMSREGNVPPGDCLIVEFSQLKETTDKLCVSYKVKEVKGEVHEE